MVRFQGDWTFIDCLEERSYLGALGVVTHEAHEEQIRYAQVPV